MVSPSRCICTKTPANVLSASFTTPRISIQRDAVIRQSVRNASYKLSDQTHIRLNTNSPIRTHLHLVQPNVKRNLMVSSYQKWLHVPSASSQNLELHMCHPLFGEAWPTIRPRSLIRSSPRCLRRHQLYPVRPVMAEEEAHQFLPMLQRWSQPTKSDLTGRLS
jgi:hypothetical protein